MEIVQGKKIVYTAYFTQHFSKLSSEGNLCPGGEVDDQPVPKSFTRMMRGVQSIGKRNGRLKKHSKALLFRCCLTH